MAYIAYEWANWQLHRSLSCKDQNNLIEIYRAIFWDDGRFTDNQEEHNQQNYHHGFIHDSTTKSQSLIRSSKIHTTLLRKWDKTHIYTFVKATGTVSSYNALRALCNFNALCATKLLVWTDIFSPWWPLHLAPQMSPANNEANNLSEKVQSIVNVGNILFPQCIHQLLPYDFFVCKGTSQHKRERVWNRHYSIVLGLWDEGWGLYGVLGG